MIDIDNQSDFEIEFALLVEITKALTQQDLEVIFTDNPSIQKLNKEHRNIDEPTDVLSFPLECDFPNMLLGSIVISTDYAKKKADELNHSFQEEITLLYIHGLLHLLGYDHEIDSGEHRAKEEELIKQFNLPDSLIVRNS